jgi:hypothetical protein
MLIPILAFLIIRKKHKNEINNYLLLGFFGVAISIYCAGIAITEISAGFPIGLTLYMLPAQPLFWMMGISIITFAYKLLLEKIKKT